MSDYRASKEERPVVEIIRLSKVFKDFWHRDKVRAVSELSLKIMPGEVFGLLGPNGSGKTTTLKIILGLLFPSSGLVRVFGHSPRNVSVKARIGFLPEESYLYRHLTALETLNFYGALFEIPAQDRRKRAEKLLDMLGLSASQNRPVGDYSKGMARRIGLAQALLNDPDLVILDEPTSGLDPIGRKEVKELIIKLKKMGRTVLLSSHLLAEVQDVCDRICILCAGEKIAEGRVDDVLVKRNMTQFQVNPGSEGLADRLKEFFRNEISEGRIRVSNPVESLEEFFMREIKSLEEKRLPPGPAQEEPADDTSVIKKLMGGMEHDKKNAEKEAQPEPGKKPASVLKSLVEEDGAMAKDGEKDSKPEKSGDDVLKRLTGGRGG